MIPGITDEQALYQYWEDWKKVIGNRLIKHFDELDVIRRNQSFCKEKSRDFLGGCQQGSW